MSFRRTQKQLAQSLTGQWFLRARITLHYKNVFDKLSTMILILNLDVALNKIPLCHNSRPTTINTVITI